MELESSAGSHFGGVFESLVKEAKKTLKVIIGNAGLTDDEPQTAIKEVEALMNSRPLTYEGADPRDEPVLTPHHFLDGQLGGQLARQVTDDITFNPRNRWRLIKNLESAGEKSIRQHLTRERDGERLKKALRLGM